MNEPRDYQIICRRGHRFVLYGYLPGHKDPCCPDCGGHARAWVIGNDEPAGALVARAWVEAVVVAAARTTTT